MAVNGGHLDTAFAQSADDRIHLLGRDHEVASDRRLATSGRLKVDHRGGSHGGWNWRAALADRVLPWNRKLVDAAIDLSLHADGLIQGQRVKVDLCCLRRRRRRRTKWRLALAERGTNGCCYGDGIAMPMNVHVVGGRASAQQVIVKRGYVDAARKQLCHHRLDL